LGSDTAKSLGLSVGLFRVIFLILAAALSGAAVSFSGLLGFVGLIVPHIMRRLMGEENSVLLPASAMGGAFFVMLCDLVARVLFAPFEIPVGIVLSFAGAPFFLWLLFKQRGGRT
jgi:iron complex transport system permease protein